MKRLLVILCLATLAAVVVCGVVPPPRAEAVTFTRHESAPGAGVSGLALADFNGDGKQDLAATRTGRVVSILLGNGDGTFAAKPDFLTNQNSLSVAAADFNDDAKLDLVTAHWGDADGCVSVLLGNGDGTFAAQADFGIVYPSSVAVGDFNGDGKQDLAIATAGPLGGVSVLLGVGDGSFAAKTDFDTGMGATSVTVGDFNGDGKQDMAATNGSTPGIVSILLGNGDGSFAAHADFGVGAYPVSLTVADFNRDGKQDLVAANAGSANSVSVLLGNGDGSFAAKTIDIGASAGSVTVGDFNGDDKQDLAATNGDTSGVVSILLGNGVGGFAGKTDFDATSGAEMGSGSLTVGDFNGDGKQDLAAANGSTSGNGSVSVLLNTTKPKIASVKPARGKVGTTVTIVGSRAGWDFGATRGTSRVYFGAKAVTKYVSWSKYQIKVRVPSLSKGKKAVTVKTTAGRSNVKYFTVL